MVRLTVLGVIAILGVSSVLGHATPAGTHSISAAVQQRLEEGRPVLAPFLHVKFCMRQPVECAVTGEVVSEIEMTRELYARLHKVNDDVNRTIIPQSKDGIAISESEWSVAPRVGDCNDFAVTKRHDLIGMGLPSSALILSVVKTAGGVGHLVLVVKSNEGDLVLDNLTSEIRPWFQTGHHFIARQSNSNPQLWVEAVGRQSNEKIAKIGSL